MSEKSIVWLIAVGLVFFVGYVVVDFWEMKVAANADIKRDCERLVELGGTDSNYIQLICRKRGVFVPDRLNSDE